MALIRNLEKAIERLEQKIALLQKTANTANESVAVALREWHNGRLGDAALSSAQDRAMPPAQRLSDMNARLEAARKDLAEAKKK